MWTDGGSDDELTHEEADQQYVHGDYRRMRVRRFEAHHLRVVGVVEVQARNRCWYTHRIRLGGDGGEHGQK